MAVAAFDPWQQVYCLAQQACLIGNTGPDGNSANQTGDAQTLATWLAGKLTNFYTAYHEQMGGTWSTVWGPVVFQHSADTTQADNVMYVAANQNRSMFVVSVAGTNFYSQYDKDMDDAVATTARWASAFPTLSNKAPAGLDPYLSSGTALGVNNLLGMRDGAKQQSLAEYLTSAASKSATLIFCGHSLGGALSPTLALALFNSNGGELSKSSWANVYLYPTAGPTPGNADLSKYVAQEFPPVPPRAQPYQCWNQNVWNSLDAVPQGWVAELLNKLPELYSHRLLLWPPLDLKWMVDDKVNKSKAGAATGAGAYTQLANQRLAGTQYKNPPEYPIPVDGTDKFVNQMGYQHTTAYDVLFDVQSVSPSQIAPDPSRR